MTSYLSLSSEQINKVSKTAVQKVISLNIPGFKDIEVFKLNRWIENAYRAALSYLENSNLNEWKQFCQATVLENARQGIRYFSVVQIFETMIEVLGKFFKEELVACTETDGQPTAKVLEKLDRRLQGLKMLTISTVIAAGLQDIRMS